MALISICIPTYRESKYIATTLFHLTKQTVWPHCEVVIADYDPEGTRETHSMISTLKVAPLHGKIRWVEVYKSGIGIARDVACKAADGDILVNLDADVRFSNHDAIEKLIKPLNQGKYLLTHCNNIIKPEEMNNEKISQANMMYEWRNNLINPLLPVLIFEPGLTLSKTKYNESEGFPDVVVGEGPIFGLKFGLKFGFDKIYFEKNTSVYVSGRRALGSNGGPILDLNYNNAYR